MQLSDFVVFTTTGTKIEMPILNSKIRFNNIIQKAMKRTAIILIGAVLLMNFNISNSRPERVAPDQDGVPKGSIQIVSSPDLYDLASEWANLFSGENTQVSIQVGTLKDEVNNKTRIPKNHLTLVSDNEYRELCRQAPWKMVVGRDPIVPVISTSHPFIGMLNQSGISAEEFKRILSNQSSLTWDQLLGNGSVTPIEVFIENNPAVLTSVGKFSGLESDKLIVNRIQNGNELTSLFSKNPDALVFIQLSEVLSSDKKEFTKGIALLPIDKNGNGQIDSFESIYEHSFSFLRGAWIGKYPRSLIHNLYFLAQVQPSEKAEIAFLDYVLTTGQDLLVSSSYSSLVMSERQSSLARLTGRNLPQEIMIGGQTGLSRVVLFGLVFIFLLVIIFFLNKNYIHKIISKTAAAKASQIISPDTMQAPKGILYDKSHTWIFMEKDGVVRVGIDDFLQHVVGPLTRIILKNPGDNVKKGEKIMTLSNNGKHLIINSPVSGIIKSQNSALLTDPSILNKSPYSEGWVFAIEPANWQAESKLMLMANKYREWLKTEFTCLKDFIQYAVRSNHDQYTQVILTDGGEIFDHSLSLFGPEIWEDFQTNFIDKSK